MASRMNLANTDVTNRLYLKQAEYDAKRKMLTNAKMTSEMMGCTFHPNIQNQSMATSLLSASSRKSTQAHEYIDAKDVYG